jgi:hypothetical protein
MQITFTGGIVIKNSDSKFGFVGLSDRCVECGESTDVFDFDKIIFEPDEPGGYPRNDVEFQCCCGNKWIRNIAIVFVFGSQIIEE